MWCAVQYNTISKVMLCGPTVYNDKILHILRRTTDRHVRSDAEIYTTSSGVLSDILRYTKTYPPYCYSPSCELTTERNLTHKCQKKKSIRNLHHAGPSLDITKDDITSHDARQHSRAQHECMAECSVCRRLISKQ